MAFTLDDLPIWPMSYPPPGYSVDGIVDAIIRALDRHGIKGVYAFSNSWALDKHPETTSIMDRWVAAGHHIANHTHNHTELQSVDAPSYIADIALGAARLDPWLRLAPERLFRHPLCYWGETEEKRVTVNAYLGAHAFQAVEVTSWLYEWRFNRAYRNCLANENTDGLRKLRRDFLDFSLAQLRYDTDCADTWFDHRTTGITLGHTLPFFADVADELFGFLIAQGVVFVPLAEALADPAYGEVASVASPEFLVFQQKLAHAAGRPMAMLAPGLQPLLDDVTELGRGQTG